MSKIKKIAGVYPATIAQAVKDANFRKEDGKVMTQSEINMRFRGDDDALEVRMHRAELLLMGYEAEISIDMRAEYGDTAVIALVANANDLVLGDIVWSHSLGSEVAEIRDGVLVFKEHYTGSVTVRAVADNASAEHTFTVACDEVAEGFSYEVSGVEADDVEADATSAIIRFVGKTITHYKLKADEMIEQNLTQEVTFAANESEEEDVTRSGVFVWNGVNVEWSVLQLKVVKYAEVGDILCSDMSIIKPVIASDGYTVESVDLQGKTPIGVCVVPTSHMEDKKARYMSLDLMDYANPDTGSQSLSTSSIMYWGCGGDLPTLPNLKAPNKAGGMTDSPLLGSKTQFNPSYFNNYDATDGLYYTYTSDSDKCPAPFTADGGINQAYRQGATGDFDGRGNTDKLIAATTVAWQSGAIENSVNAGNYQTACCCRRYRTAGTNAGDWYLPAMGELGYIMYNAQLIDNVLMKIGKIMNSKTYNLWSSTEWGMQSGSSYSYLLNLSFGFVYKRNRGYNFYVRAFLAH